MRHVALLSLLACTACGGGVLRNGVYTEDGLRYRIGQPGADFHHVEVGDNDVSFADEALGTIGVNATCEGYDDVPAQALLNHLLFGTTDRKRLLQETVTLDGRGALHSIYELALDGVPVTLEVYVLAKDGCVFDFSLITTQPQPAAAAAAFHHLVSGFALLHLPD